MNCELLKAVKLCYMIETSLKSKTFVSQMKKERKIQANGFSFNLARAQKTFSQQRKYLHNSQRDEM